MISMTKVPDAEPQDPEPVQDWLDSEPPLTKMVITDLQRLKYRARARWIPIVAITAVMTAAITYKVAHKPMHHIAHVVLAIQEQQATREELIPVTDLRGYVTTVLMPEEPLLALIEKYDLAPLRKSQGPKYALGELWSMITVDVYRNYFLYDIDETRGAGRSARIGISVDYPDADIAYDIARDLGTIIIDTAATERDATAHKIETGAKLASDAARRRVVELELQIAKLDQLRSEALAGGFTAQVAGYDVEIAALEANLHSAREAQYTIAQRSGTEQLRAAVFSAGLSLDVTMVEDRRPDAIEPGRYRLAMMTVVVFLTLFVVVALYIGAFDTRIHDLDDVSRLGIPVVGQVPGFPGDGVGSLRQRGVTRRGVPWSWR